MKLNPNQIRQGDDGGVTFAREVNGGPRQEAWWPNGTNILNADEAAAMVRFMVEALPSSGVRDADEWRPIETAPLDVPVLLAVGWPGQRRSVVGERNISSDGENFGADHYWVYGAQGGAIATEIHIGLPTHWRPLPSPPLPQQDGGG